MTTFRSQSVYTVFAFVSLVMAGLFLWDLVHGVEAGSVLFFAISMGLMAWSFRAALTTVSLASNQLVVKAPPTRPRVEYRQMLSVTEEGRMGKSIVVAYHPCMEDGLLDLDRALTVALPALKNQDVLFEQLVQKAPL